MHLICYWFVIGFAMNSKFYEIYFFPSAYGRCWDYEHKQKCLERGCERVSHDGQFWCTYRAERYYLPTRYYTSGGKNTAAGKKGGVVDLDIRLE